jgi:glycosyltransferase involved in cell wall biosynthesis
MNIFPYGSELFEGHEFASAWSDDPNRARGYLQRWLDHPGIAEERGHEQRERFIEHFGRDRIAQDWAAFLGVP